MNIETGAADAATDGVSAPEVASEPTPRGAIDRAFAALDAQEARGEPEAPEGSEDAGEGETPATERPRGPDGRFLAKEGGDAPEKPVTEAKPAIDKPTSFADAPARFSADAKASWKDAPEPVRAEIGRAIRELEGGIERYRTEVEPLRQYMDMAKRGGTTLDKALENYIGIEAKLRQDLVGGLAQICQSAGTSLKDVAAQIMGQKPDATQSQADATIRELRAELAALKEQVGTVDASFQQAQSRATQRELQSIVSDATKFPRYAELRETMGQLIQGGFVPEQADTAQLISEAYTLADRLRPGPVVPPPNLPAPTPAPDPAAQTRKGSLSISGAPGSGSNPTNRKPPSSAREALDRSFAALGL